MKITSALGLRGQLILSGLLVLLSACRGAPAPAPSGPINLYTRDVQVSYQRAGSGVQQASTLEEQKLDENDAVTVNSTGRAHLAFQDFLVVDIFRDSDLRIKGMSAPDAPPAYQLRLEGGTINGTSNAQALAGERVEAEVRIDTKWAVIRKKGTVFIVHFDKASEQTWVVVKRGAMSVAAAGKEVIVEGGQQTWVEPGKAPIDPIPACRNLVGNRFPLIDDLTNDVLPDLDWLCTDSAMLGSSAPSTLPPPTSTIAPSPIPVPTSTPRPPTPTPLPTLTPYASFVADPASIQACACTTLRWDAGSIAALAIDGTPVSLQGSRQECPSSSRSYALRASTISGTTIDRSASVQVLQPSINFRADSTSLSYPGECTALRWDVDNVKAVYLNGQGVAGHDSRQVCPSTTTTYNLRANTACGDVDRYVTVQAFSDTSGPTIQSVTVNNRSPGETLCVYSWISIEALVTDLSGVNRVILGGSTQQCSYDGSGDSCAGKIINDREMSTSGGNLFIDQLSNFSFEGTLTIKIQAFDEYGNKSETGNLEYPVKHCID